MKSSFSVDYNIYYNTELPIVKKGKLYISELRDESVFIYGKKSNKTSELKEENNLILFKQKGIAKFNYLNINLDSIYSKEKILNDEFIVKEAIPNLNWHLTEEEKKNGALTLKKATLSFRGRHYTAWYCEDYPLSFGPWKFHGLPGLIFEIYDNTQRYRWIAMKVNTEKTPIPVNVKENIQISLKEYANKRYNSSNSFFNSSKLPRGYNITKNKIPRNGIEIKFEWEEEIIKD